MLLEKDNFIIVESIEELTPDAIQKVIQAHKMRQVPRLKKLMDYYIGNHHEINKKKYTDPNKPCRKITNPFCNLIVNQLDSVFIGEPIKYESEDTQALLELKVINALNETDYIDTLLARNSSVYGVAFLNLYMDSNSDIRFTVLDTPEVIPVFDTSLDLNLIGAIRYYTIESLTDINDDKHMIDVYTKEEVLHYMDIDGGIRLLEVERHYFDDVPVVIFANNESWTGSFENVISLVDAYDSTLSSVQDVQDYFSDSYLVLTNAIDTDPDQLTAMAENRILLLPEGASAEFLNKTSDSTTLQNHLATVKQNIYRFSSAIDLDEKDLNNVSGVSLKYRMQQIASISRIKEALFIQGINRKNKMIFQILSIMGRKVDPSTIKPVFSINIPQNELEILQMVQGLQGIVSQETLLNLIPNVDAQDEIKKLEEEDKSKNAMLDPYAGQFNVPEEPNEEIVE